jgi:hypothetical protein
MDVRSRSFFVGTFLLSAGIATPHGARAASTFERPSHRFDGRAHPGIATGGAAIDLTLTGTLDLTTDSCGDDTAFAIPPGTDVRFCYSAHNTGDVTFELHDLGDSNGTIFTDEPFTLQPGFVLWLMQSRQPLSGDSFVATWTSTDGAGGNLATASDATPITWLPPLVGCNLPASTFSAGIPVGWTSYDWRAMAALPDPDVDWSGLAGCGEAANYTGGRGDVACGSSLIAGAQAYDTQLRTHSFSLAGVAAAKVEFRVNYQDAAAGGDGLWLDASTDGGTNWTPLVHSTEADFGAFRALPGSSIVVDLASLLGQENVRLGWRYVNSSASAHDEYVQIDDVRVLCDGGLFFDRFESGDAHAWSLEGSTVEP